MHSDTRKIARFQRASDSQLLTVSSFTQRSNYGLSCILYRHEASRTYSGERTHVLSHAIELVDKDEQSDWKLLSKPIYGMKHVATQS